MWPKLANFRREMVPFSEHQLLLFLVFFLISMLVICLIMWLTCMCLDWKRRRGTKSIVTLAFAEGEVALVTSRKVTGQRATKEADRYYATIVAIAFAFYSYVSAVITRTTNNHHHPSLTEFANTLHDAAKTLESNGNRSPSGALLDRVSESLDSSRIGVLRTPRPSAPPPAPPSANRHLLSDIPSASVRMTMIDDFSDDEEDTRTIRGIPV